MQHRLQKDLEQAPFMSSWRAINTPEGYHLGGGKTLGNGVTDGWSPGAHFIHSYGAAGAQWYVNEGSNTAASWQRVEGGSIELSNSGENLTVSGSAGYVLLSGAASYLRLNDNNLMQLGSSADVNLGYQATLNYPFCYSGVGTELWSRFPPWLGYPDPAKFYQVFDDFVEYDATSGPWTLTEDDAACTQAVNNQVGGTLLLTNKATTDNNAQQIVWGNECFKLAANKHLWFEARCKAAAGATEIDVAMGLVAAGEDLTGVADNLPGDGVTIHKDDGAATIKLTASKDGTDTGQNADIGTLTTGWHRFGFYINGVTSIQPYFDNASDTAITATICDDEELAPFFMVRNGDGVTTQTLEIDYVRCIQLR